MALALGFSVILTVGVLISFTEPVNADECSVGWNGCEANGVVTPGSPGDMSGCSVEFQGVSMFDNTIGYYQYTCGTQVKLCAYRYSCPPILD